MRTTSRREGFEAFVESRQARWLRIAYAMTGNWHSAEDVVQTVLTRMYVRWSRVVRSRSPDAYVQRAIVNAVTDERRRPWRRESARAELPEETTDEVGDDRLMLVVALAGLPPGQRAVVVLRYLEDLDIRQTADVLGCSIGTVKSQSTHGLRKLRQILDATTEEGRVS